MAKQMVVSVTLRRPVADTDKANDFINETRLLMAAYEDLTISGFCSKQMEDPPTPPT